MAPIRASPATGRAVVRTGKPSAAKAVFGAAKEGFPRAGQQIDVLPRAVAGDQPPVKGDPEFVLLSDEFVGVVLDVALDEFFGQKP
jgi:hypothetical protein